MKLTILERILLLQLLPPEANVATLRIIRDLKKNLGFSEEEVKKCNIRADGDMTLWDDDKYEAEVPIGEKATDIIRDALKQADSRNKLMEQHIPLYERFVEGK